MWKMSRRTKHILTGYVFVLPFIIGFAAFFLFPFIMSLVLSLSRMEIASGGYTLSWIGFDNYHRALFVHESFVRDLVETLVTLLRDVPAIIMFSLFISVILNQQFKGRLLARVIFFLPVIFASGAVQLMENYDYLTNSLTQGQSQSGALGGQALMAVFHSLKLPETVLNYILAMVQGVSDIIRSSGIQILVFMAGLQSIPSSLYEASAIEGSTAWEDFWKITFPIMSPMIPTVVLYTIIDSYASVNNKIMELIRTTAFQGMGYGTSSAMAWLFFLVIVIILFVFLRTLSRWVIYQD